MTRREGGVGRRGQAIRRGLLLFLLFFVLYVGWENRDLYEHDTLACEPVSVDATPFQYERVYPWMMHWRLGTQASGRVAVVFIPEEMTEVQQNLCRGRAYMARLIDTLVAERPAALVLDKYFSDKSCLADETEKHETALLQRAVQGAVAAGIPVVVGEATGDLETKQDRTCLVKKTDSLPFAGTQSGLTKLNRNREQIPLRWRVFDTALSKAGDPPSFAMRAATVAAGSALEQRVALHGDRQPYARLDVSIDSVSSGDLLSGKVPSGTLRKKVVVIGSQSRVMDRWVVLGVARWGYELQADYIDALVSGQYLRAVPSLMVVALLVVFVGILEGVPFVWWWWHSERQRHPEASQNRFEWWWYVGWPPGFALGVVLLCLGVKFLPPLSVVLFALTAGVGHLLYFAMSYFGHRVSPFGAEVKS